MIEIHRQDEYLVRIANSERLIGPPIDLRELEVGDRFYLTNIHGGRTANLELYTCVGVTADTVMAV